MSWRGIITKYQDFCPLCGREVKKTSVAMWNPNKYMVIHSKCYRERIKGHDGTNTDSEHSRA